MFLILIFAFINSAPFSYSDEACLMPGLRKAYEEDYLGMRKKYVPPPNIRIDHKLTSNARYQKLIKKKNPSDQDRAEIKALKGGYGPYHARLLGLNAVGGLSTTQSLELAALNATNGNTLAAELAVKGAARTKEENTRYNALIESGGDYRVAFLALEDLGGRLTNGEKAELAALKKTYGDRIYANIKRKQAEIKERPASGLKLTSCEKDYMALVEAALNAENPQGVEPANVL